MSRLATAAWIGLFLVCGRLRRRRRAWHPQGGSRVLVLAPHPDDEALGCGGTIIRHVENGDKVTVMIVTDGRQSRAHDLDADAMSDSRRHEAFAVARLLGVERLIYLALPEGNWNDDELQVELTSELQCSPPDLIYAPSWLDYHPEHRRVAQCLARAVGRSTTVRVCTYHVPLTSLANRFVDVSSDMMKLKRVFSAYQTQQASLLRGLRMRRYSGALNRCGSAVEEFWELSSEAYRCAHRSDQVAPSVRGVRRLAFSDPLSYLRGRSSRREINRRAQRAGE